MSNFILGLSVGISLTIAFILVTGGKSLSVQEKIAVEHQCGEYNSTTGDFQWYR